MWNISIFYGVNVLTLEWRTRSGCVCANTTRRNTINTHRVASNILGSVRAEKRRKDGYVLPVVSVCTGRQVRPAPSSCCHRPNIICTYLHFRQTIRLSPSTFLSPHEYRLSLILSACVSASEINSIPLVQTMHIHYAFVITTSRKQRAKRRHKQKPRAYSFAIYQRAFFSAVIALH